MIAAQTEKSSIGSVCRSVEIIAPEFMGSIKRAQIYNFCHPRQQTKASSKHASTLMVADETAQTSSR
jgi:hypothetical protein